MAELPHETSSAPSSAAIASLAAVCRNEWKLEGAPWHRAVLLQWERPASSPLIGAVEAGSGQARSTRRTLLACHVLPLCGAAKPSISRRRPTCRKLIACLRELRVISTNSCPERPGAARKRHDHLAIPDVRPAGRPAGLALERVQPERQRSGGIDADIDGPLVQLVAPCRPLDIRRWR